MARSIAALILALSTLAVLLVSGHATPMASAGRRLKQLTLFYDTPGASGSTSLDLSANAGVGEMVQLRVPVVHACMYASAQARTRMHWVGQPH
jgi:hypothetical protein